MKLLSLRIVLGVLQPQTLLLAIQTLHRANISHWATILKLLHKLLQHLQQFKLKRMIWRSRQVVLGEWKRRSQNSKRKWVLNNKVKANQKKRVRKNLKQEERIEKIPLLLVALVHHHQRAQKTRGLKMIRAWKIINNKFNRELNKHRSNSTYLSSIQAPMLKVPRHLQVSHSLMHQRIPPLYLKSKILSLALCLIYLQLKNPLIMFQPIKLMSQQSPC